MIKNINNISKENNYEIEKPKEIIPICSIIYYLIFTLIPSNKINIEAQIISFKK
jgi:hypothetical protein